MMRMLSNIKCGKFVLYASVFSLVGCAAQRPYVPTEQLGSFKVDCSIAEQQVAWLLSIKPTAIEKQNARVNVAFFGPWSKEYSANKELAENKIDWLIDYNIRDVYRQCVK